MFSTAIGKDPGAPPLQKKKKQKQQLHTEVVQAATHIKLMGSQLRILSYFGMVSMFPGQLNSRHHNSTGMLAPASTP